MSFHVHHGDCLAHMRTMKPASVDSIVTDPPYGLSFMGKDWDHGVPGVHFWEEALRVAKPGAHLLAFGGTRTFHRLVVAIEDAGWEIRDTLMWVYGSGFPKSHDVSKAIDREEGAERETTGRITAITGNRPNGSASLHQGGGLGEVNAGAKVAYETIPATEAANQWQGWGTALKPAWEPIVLARKPLEGTVAQNVQQHGTGALNIDGCRVAWAGEADAAAAAVGYAKSMERGTVAAPTSLPTNYDKPPYEPDKINGRWPANLIHDGSEEVLKHFPDEAPSSSGTRQRGTNNNVYGEHQDTPFESYGGTGSAARFFYCAKASKADRDEGLERFEAKVAGGLSGRGDGSLGSVTVSRNIHPTVKPTDLMRYLCRLVTPPKGTVLDPFTGSGSTGKAAVIEGFNFLGCDTTAEYIPIAIARIKRGEAIRIEEQGLFAEIGM